MAKEYSQSNKMSNQQKQEKFYGHLKAYLIFTGFMFFIKFFMHAHVDFYPVVFWWGFGVAIHYLRTFGWEHLQNPTTQEQQQRYEREEELEEDIFVELKPKQKVKSWREQDLV